jgi:O-acetyl-ADP-ribose deacetylase (regulator of RNase III)
VYSGSPRDADLLRSAYVRCLELAREKGVRSIAFPSLSTGAYGYPVEEAAPVAVEAVRGWLRGNPDAVATLTFVLFDERTYRAYEEALKR